MPQLLGSSTETSVPPMEAYLEIESHKDYQNLKAINSNKFSARNIIPIPPFLLQMINNKIIKMDGDNREVMLKVIQKGKKIDINFTENTIGEGIGTASSPCHHILH